MTKNDSGVKFYIASQEQPASAAPVDSGLQEKLDAVTRELDQLKQQAANAQALPDDALKRLEGVKGIGPDLAKAALAALTAKGGEK